MKKRQITNLDVIKGTRKALPPANQVIAAKKNKLKADKTGRKAKHKGKSYGM